MVWMYILFINKCILVFNFLLLWTILKHTYSGLPHCTVLESSIDISVYVPSGVKQYIICLAVLGPACVSFIPFFKTIFIECLVNAGHCSSALLVLMYLVLWKVLKSIVSHSYFSNMVNERGWGQSVGPGSCRAGLGTWTAWLLSPGVQH